MMFAIRELATIIARLPQYAQLHRFCWIMAFWKTGRSFLLENDWSDGLTFLHTIVHPGDVMSEQYMSIAV